MTGLQMIIIHKPTSMPVTLFPVPQGWFAYSSGILKAVRLGSLLISVVPVPSVAMEALQGLAGCGCRWRESSWPCP